MTSSDAAPFTLTRDSGRLSSIGEIRWKVPQAPEPLTIDRTEISARVRQTARVVDDEFLLATGAFRLAVEPIQLAIRGAIPSYPDWRITRSLPIEISFDGDDTVIAADTVFHRFGTGVSIDEAISDLKDNLFVYFDIVQEYTTDKRPANQALLAHLLTYLSPVAE
jgi:hypothetical protein